MVDKGKKQEQFYFLKSDPLCSMQEDLRFFSLTLSWLSAFRIHTEANVKAESQ